jgi:hypothetical protein
MDLQFSYRLNGALEITCTDSKSAMKKAAQGIMMALRGERREGLDEFRSAQRFFRARSSLKKQKKRVGSTGSENADMNVQSATEKGLKERVGRGTVVQLSSCTDWEKSVDIEVLPGTIQRTTS